MPTQWRTIAPIVGRTATQCLERYQKLLDEAEAKENDELGLGGPAGGETSAPSADDVRRLRPGELDPDPESKPARPDTIDLDEDEKEMLSEARARLANTQGKKAKRKARERQLEESRRLALLQKRRELKNAGINIKIVNRKKGQMDYNADIPFEKPAVPGFYDTQEENTRNEKQREAFDPRKQQLANKRKGDQDSDVDPKRRKGDKPGAGVSAASAAAAKAGQMQRIREAEQSSKRRSLNLPAPQVGEAELEDIVKMGMIGEQAHRVAGEGDNEATKGFIGNYTGIVGSTPIRTPRAPPQEDHIANEIRNIRALTETQSSLLGGENTPLHEGSASTGFDGVAPRKHVVATPNPLATPARSGTNGVGTTPLRTPAGPGATPMRTPRDNFAINHDDLEVAQMVGSTPKEVKLREQAVKSQLRSRFASLPKPKELDFELELPEERDELHDSTELSEEDAAVRDRRDRELREAALKADLKRRTQVMQRGLPRPLNVDIDLLLERASQHEDPVELMIASEAALLIVNDNLKYPLSGGNILGSSKTLEKFDDETLAQARLEIAKELPTADQEQKLGDFEVSWINLHDSHASLPGLAIYEDDDTEVQQTMIKAFDEVQSNIMADAKSGNELEKKLGLHLGGYQKRAKTLRQKIGEASKALEDEKRKLDSFRNLQIAEEAALPARIEALQTEVDFVRKREKEAQDLYRIKMQELSAISGQGMVNGGH